MDKEQLNEEGETKQDGIHSDGQKRKKNLVFKSLQSQCLYL